MKTKRKDKYKNRNKPTQSWPLGKNFRGVYDDDGKYLGIVAVSEPLKTPIGSICGRCGEAKGINNKCINRWTYGTLPKHIEAIFEKLKLPIKKKGYFCFLDGKAFN